MVWGGRRDEGSGWGTCVYLWWVHVDIWQNQYNIVKLKNKKKKQIIARNTRNCQNIWKVYKNTLQNKQPSFKVGKDLISYTNKQ